MTKKERDIFKNGYEAGKKDGAEDVKRSIKEALGIMNDIEQAINDLEIE